MPQKQIGTITGAARPPKMIRRRKNRMAAPLGFVIIVLVVVGFFTVVSGGTKLFFALTDRTAEKEKYASMLNPIVMLDPPNFDNPSRLNQSFVLQTNLWSIVQDRDISSFNTDDYGRYLVPVADLEVRCTALYGGLASIPRVSMTADGEIVTETDKNDYSTVIFEYLPEYDSFAIPIMGEIGLYYSTVEGIQKDGEFLYLTVAYHPLQSNWYDEMTGNNSAVSKYKVFTLQKAANTGEYFVAGLRDPDVEF